MWIFGVSILAFLLLNSCFLILASPVHAHSQTQAIRMTQNGFEPSSVMVDQNQTIIFLNEDSRDRWPASNPHPIHDLYPEFDPKAPIKPGGSWLFKPQKAGEWKYHDHLFPHMRGILVVEQEPGTVLKTNQSPNWLENIKNFFSNLQKQILLFFSKKEDPLLTWNNLKEKYKGQAGSSGNIHDQAHLLGGLIYERYGLEGLSKCSPEFSFGCYHGFLDKAFQKNLDQLNKAEEACKALGEGGPSASCIHGIGHGVASFYQTADLKTSLKECRRLSDSLQQYCTDGVFMEYVRSAPETTFRKEDPYYPCDGLESEFGPIYAFSCGRNQPPMLISRFKFSFDEVVGVCLNWTSEPSKLACIDALGFILAGGQDEKAIIVGCRKLQDADLILKCTKSAAGELVFQEAPLWQEKSQAICQSLSSGSEECSSYVSDIIRQYGRKVKINFRKLNPGEDINSYLRSQIKVCYDSDGRDGCYKQVADTLYNQFGLRKNLDLLKQNENYQEVYARCHEVTHYLSRLEYEKQGSISKVYAQCDSTCHGGCYHGTMEAYLKQNPSADFAKICGKEGDYQKPLEYNECLHGLGHAAMFIYDMELKKSLSLCDNLFSQKERDRCYTGVFMENSSSSTSFDHKSIYIKADDPYFPCNNLEEKYLPLCWQYQSSYFSILTHQDWQKVASMCLQVPSAYQDNCFKTVGTNQVGFTQSMQRMKDDCILMPSEHFQDVCVTGVVSSLAYRFVGDLGKMVDFCSMVDPKHQESCFRQLGTGLLEWNSNKDLAKASCQQITDAKGVSWCLSAI